MLTAIGLKLLIQAVFEAPHDLVAIDDVKYEAILCGKACLALRLMTFCRKRASWPSGRWRWRD